MHGSLDWFCDSRGNIQLRNRPFPPFSDSLFGLGILRSVASKLSAVKYLTLAIHASDLVIPSRCVQIIWLSPVTLFHWNHFWDKITKRFINFFVRHKNMVTIKRYLTLTIYAVKAFHNFVEFFLLIQTNYLKDLHFKCNSLTSVTQCENYYLWFPLVYTCVKASKQAVVLVAVVIS